MNPEEERPVVDLDAIGAPEPAEPRLEASAEVADQQPGEAAEPEVGAEPEPSAAVEPGSVVGDQVAEAEPVAAGAEAAEPEHAAESASEPEPEPGPRSDEDIPEDPADLVAMDRSLPDLTEELALESALEALLLVVDSPASEESLADAVEQPVDRVTGALRAMSERFTERGSGIDLRRVGEGWRFFTRDTYAPFVEKLLLDGQRSKLTRAALETLAVIAYRQPVTRSRVAAVRGVNVDGVIRTLLARGLIEEAGTDPETGGTLYVTTELFLERLGLPSLNDLPPIAPLLPEVDAIDDI